MVLIVRTKDRPYIYLIEGSSWEMEAHDAIVFVLRSEDHYDRKRAKSYWTLLGNQHVAESIAYVHVTEERSFHVYLKIAYGLCTKGNMAFFK